MNKLLTCLALMFVACTGEVDVWSNQTPIEATTNQPVGCYLDESNGQCFCPSSPIIIDTGGDGIRLSGPGEGVPFRLTDHVGIWSWPLSADDGWLVLPGLNGTVDNGSEMFGDHSLQALGTTEKNGFASLAFYDLNGDHKIDAQDPVFPQLRVWLDGAVMRDGISQPQELLPLSKFGITSLSVSFVSTPTDVDSHGNQFRYRSSLAADAGSPVSTIVRDVWVVPMPTSTEPGPTRTGSVGTTQDYVQWTCWAWWYAVKGGCGGTCGACDNIYTVNDPIDTAYNGVLSRQVARYSTSTSIDTAFNRAYQLTADAVIGPIGSPQSQFCSGAEFPVPDLYYAAPYDKDGSWLAPRVKCFAQTIITGGGTGGGGC